MFDEIGDGIFRRQYEFLDLNIGVIIGSEGVLVIDSRESHMAADELAADIRSLTSDPVRWVVNTHWHWDHAFGNAVFADAEIWGHRRCAERLEADPEAGKNDARRWVPEHRHAEIDAVDVTPPARVFEAVASLDIGRRVDLGYHGRGHTDNDIVIHADDVTFMGDLVEDGGPPYMGDGYPLEWPHTLSVIHGVAGTTVVPGHGGVRDRDWMLDQRADMEIVAARLSDVLYEGRSIENAAADGPFPVATMTEALERGVAAARE